VTRRAAEVKESASTHSGGADVTEEEIKKGLERFASKPDDALECAAIGAAFLGCSERTLRYHKDARRVYITPDRYNFQVGNLRQMAGARKGARVRAERKAAAS
jgi:hypothetical protein